MCGAQSAPRGCNWVHRMSLCILTVSAPPFIPVRLPVGSILQILKKDAPCSPRLIANAGEGDVSCEPGRLPALPPMTYDKSQSRGWGVGATYTRLASVVPFEAMTWRAHGVGRASLSKAHPSATAALAMIRECERELREQLALESSLTGLEFTVQVRRRPRTWPDLSQGRNPQIGVEPRVDGFVFRKRESQLGLVLLQRFRFQAKLGHAVGRGEGQEGRRV